MSCSLEEALERVTEGVSTLPPERAPLTACIGRVLARELRAPMDQPPFSRSPLDGYALRGSDISRARRETPVRVRVVDKRYAGDCPGVAVGPGEAVRLMTGAMLPPGADCVVRQEDTDGGENEVEIYVPVPPGANVCRQGEEYQKGELLIPKGQRIDAAAAAVAAGAGQETLEVFRRPRAALVATGDEICPPGAALRPGAVYDVNTPYLQARLEKMGAQVTAACRVGDDLQALESALAGFAGQADLVVTTGGVSVGQKDLLPKALSAIGAEIVFHGVAIKPGMPTLFARLGGTAFLCLSGNPFSAAVPFELLARPLLGKMTGDDGLALRPGVAVAQTAFEKPSPSRRFLRGRLCSGRLWLPGGQANGQMRSMIGCNCLADIPAGAPPVRPGDEVRVWQGLEDGYGPCP